MTVMTLSSYKAVLGPACNTVRSPRPQLHQSTSSHREDLRLTKQVYHVQNYYYIDIIYKQNAKGEKVYTRIYLANGKTYGHSYY